MAVKCTRVGFYMPVLKALYTKAESKGKIASQWGIFDGTNMIAMDAAALLAGYLVNSGKYNLMFGVIIVFYRRRNLICVSTQRQVLAYTKPNSMILETEQH